MYSSLIQSLRERRDGLGEAGADSGFTLIELMVVLLILAILLAIAIPAFLGATNTANDRAAQSNLNTASTDAKVCYTNNSQSYTACTTTVLQTSESSLTFVAAGGSTGESQITVLTAADGNAIMLATWSPKTSTCWMFADTTAAETAGLPAGALGTGEHYGKAAGSTAASCGTAAPAGTLTWSNAGYPS